MLDIHLLFNCFFCCLVILGKCVFPPHQFSHCTLASQAGRGRCGLLISHYPLYFKSIVNYLPKALFLKLEKWTAQDRPRFAWQKYSVLCRVKTALPPLLLIGPSVFLSEAAIPFCTAPPLHFSQPHNFHFSSRRETKIFMHNFSLSGPL